MRGLWERYLSLVLSLVYPTHTRKVKGGGKFFLECDPQLPTISPERHTALRLEA